MESNGDEEDNEDTLAVLEIICIKSGKVYHSYARLGKGSFDRLFTSWIPNA